MNRKNRQKHQQFDRQLAALPRRPFGGFGRAYMDPATETPAAGSTEVWQIANLTGDAHPIHLHLVNVQVLARQPFNAATYTGTPSFTGPARGPDHIRRLPDGARLTAAVR
jgi:FtsP/CotA-like multicopper oxidase with cupredoxin domain